MRKILVLGLAVMSVLLLSQNIKDLEQDSPFFEAVNYVVKAGIMELDDKGNFRGALLVTRYDVAQYIYRLVMRFELEKLKEKLPLLDELDIVKTATIALDERTSNLEKNYNSLNSRVDSAVLEITSTASEVLELKTKADSLEEAFNNLSLAFTSFKQETAGIDSEILRRIDVVEKNLKKLEESAQQNSSRLTLLEKNLENVSREIASLEEAITQLSSDTRNFLTWKQNAGEDILMLKGRTGSLSEQLDQLRKELDSLSSDVVNLRNEMDQKVSAVSSRASVQEEKVSDLEKSISQMTTKFQTLESNVENLKSDLENLNKRFSGLEESVAEDQQNRTTMESEIQDLKKQVSDLSRRIERLSSDLTALSQRVEEKEKSSLQMDTSTLMVIGAGALALLLGIILLAGR